MQDDAYSNSFLVRITELEAADAGTYWCGSDSQWTVGNYTKIQLSVGKMNMCRCGQSELSCKFLLLVPSVQTLLLAVLMSLENKIKKL